MSVAATSWLPKGAFDAAAVKAAFASPLAAWSSEWFMHAAAASSQVRPPSGQSRQTMRIKGERTRLELTGVGKRQLLESALEVDLADAMRGECDNHVLDKLAGEIAADLVGRLDAILTGDRGDTVGESICVGVTLGKGDVLEFEVSEASIVPLLKAGFGAVRAAAEPVRSRSEALRTTKLVVHGSLGLAEITLNDLKELATGDVLVVDRALDERVALKIAGQARPFVHGALRTDSGRLSVCL